jgi:hypothetical protein
LVVFDPGAGFDGDHAGDGRRDFEGAVIGRKDFAVEEFVFARGPGDALRAGWVVEMRVGVDDGEVVGLVLGGSAAKISPAARLAATVAAVDMNCLRVGMRGDLKG